ncbi:hypothetical protein [Kordia sp.]|uniref:hypothetical protein n=1 Tax=Kordia sp. TaxID=1965332 RepID=UPI003D6ABA37
MITKLTSLSFLLFLFIHFNINAQSKKNDSLNQTQNKGLKQDNNNNDNNTDDLRLSNLDPRQYIEIYEIKGKKKIPIWSYQQDAMTVNQERKILDTKSKIKIEFLKEQIVQNLDFKGTISIEGKLVSRTGAEDPVEVLPYSRIGQEKTKIGITNRPPKEIATVFVNLIIECLKTNKKISETQITNSKYESPIKRLKEYIGELSLDITDEEDYEYYAPIFFSIDSDPPDIGNKTELEKFKAILKAFEKVDSNIINNYPAIFIDAKKFKANEPEIDKKNFMAGLNIFLQRVLEKAKLEKSSDFLIFRSKIRDFNSSLKIILNYIDYFKKSGEEAEDAFLLTIKLDHIALDRIENNLKLISEDLTDYLLKNTDSVGKVDSRVEAKYIQATSEIQRLTQIQGTEIGELEQLGYLFDNKAYSASDAKIKKEAIDILSLAASKIIYRELDYATIDLQKERGQEGDFLYMYLVLEESERRSGSSSNIIQKILPIGTYELRNTEWEVKVADSFLLVHRINEPSPENDNSLSPSNFKGAAGISLLLTYRGDGELKNKFFNFLEPSFGINVSYLDFSTEDDIEVGAGLVLGLFNNKIFFTTGINLNRTGIGESRPMYWGVGFSFANLIDKLLVKN